MITRSVDVIKSKPGIYLATSATTIAFIEVTVDGIVHQLKAETFERDGILREGYWNTLAIKGFYGPLSRPTTPETSATCLGAAANMEQLLNSVLNWNNEDDFLWVQYKADELRAEIAALKQLGGR